MKRLLAVFLAGSVMLVALIMTGSQPRPETKTVGDFRVQIDARNPWTHLKLPDPKTTFSFAVVADRTGGPRPDVFAKAVRQLNRLRPAFVLSVGDLIPGFTEDELDLDQQWRAFDKLVGQLTMPFFYVPGNHDLANTVQEKHWRERFGRRYYHFVYRNVLFLVLNADDPPGRYGRLSAAQIAYARRTLEENAKASWTVVALHRPLWDGYDAEETGWLTVESALAGRNYTVFAGHEHSYRKFVRHGMNYYQLATTGGSSDLRGIKHGEFDHVAWVTLDKEGPTVANILLDGVLSDDPTATP